MTFHQRDLMALTRLYSNPRNIRRQRLVAHLHAAGARPTLEAMLEVEQGKPLDDVLEHFARVPVRIYQDIGADELPICPLGVIKGERRG
jgi:hypothetical protein